MAEDIIDLDGMRLNFTDLSNSTLRTESKKHKNHSFYIGQLINLQIVLPLSKEGKNKLKIPHPPRSPVSLNLVSSFMRQLSSSVYIECSFKDVQETQYKVNGDEVGREWTNCSVASSYHEIFTQTHKKDKTKKMEPYLSKDQCFYHIPVQVQIPEIPSDCDRIELSVHVKPTRKHTPSWLSSPTRQDGVIACEDNVDAGIVKGKNVTQKLKIIHPPHLQFQHKCVSGKQILFIQVKNTTFHSIRVEECVILPESCPKSTGNQCSGCTRKPGYGHSKMKCVIHGNIVKIIPSIKTDIFPISLAIGECYSLCYNLNTTSVVENIQRDELSLEVHIRWCIPYYFPTDTSNVFTTYRLPMLKIKQAFFVMCAASDDGANVAKGDSFTVNYSITNKLQDFLSIKLHWNPILLNESEDAIRNLDKLQHGLVCQDPCVCLGPCSYGSTVQVKVRFHALTAGVFEVCKHMKINLRYVIPGSETASLASPSSQTSAVSEDHLAVVSEELWRSRSGSGSSFNDPRVASAEERRLSFANKSYSFGDLGPAKSSDSDSVTKQNSPGRSPRRAIVMTPASSSTLSASSVDTQVSTVGEITNQMS